MTVHIPTRVQRKRTKGFRLPPNTLCCTRPGKWGNPFQVGISHPVSIDTGNFKTDMVMSRELACQLFYHYLQDWTEREPDAMEELLQYDHLACYCSLAELCHVDMIIQLLKEMYWLPTLGLSEKV